jgi:hypothetical protein
MERASTKKPQLETFRDQLVIDPDDLDSALVEQPDLFYHVAESYVMAVARRDEAKLTMEQATADLDKQFREAALAAEEKLTEAAMSRKLASAPRIQTLERELLALRAEADRWQALKEAYQQRSFMLRELVARSIAQLSTLSLDRGIQSSRRDLTEATAQRNHVAASELRRSRRPDHV